MLKLEYDKKQIEEVIDKIVKKTMNMDLTWDWPCGVAYYGIGEAYEKTGKKEYLDLLKDRVDELIDLGLPKVWTVNACAMGHCLITLYKATGDEKYHEILMSKIHYIQKDALRFADNVLQHTVSANNDFPEQCWCDTLFMAAFLLLRVGVMELMMLSISITGISSIFRTQAADYGITDMTILQATTCREYTGEELMHGQHSPCHRLAESFLNAIFTLSLLTLQAHSTSSLRH